VFIIKKIKENKIISNIFAFGSTTFLSAGLSFIMGVITRNLLGPEKFGYWLSISILFSFIPLLQLGTVNAMNREVPFYLARKDYDKVQEIKSLSISFIFTIPLLLVSILFIISILLFLTNINYQYKIGLLLASVISFFIFLSSFVEMNYKSEQNFKIASRLVLIKSVSQSLLTLFFVYYIGYVGLYIGMLLSLIIEVIYGRKSFFNVKFQFDINKYKDLIKIGFPILLVGMIWSILIASDRVIISYLMTPRDLGNYGVGMLIFNTLMLLPQVIGQVYYPRIVQLISIQDYEEIYRQYIRVNSYIAISMAIVILFFYYIFPKFISIFMPSYQNGIPAGQVLILGIYPLTLVNFSANFFNAVKGQVTYLLILIFTIFINVILSILFLSFKYDIVSIAWATSFSYVLYSILMNWFFINKLKSYLGRKYEYIT